LVKSQAQSEGSNDPRVSTGSALAANFTRYPGYTTMSL